jgi:glycosyltransferase involved in cell wall biosynthesis
LQNNTDGNMQKIIHIIDGLEQGGAETALFKLLSKYNLQQYQVMVICLLGEGFYSPKIKALGVEVVHLHLNKKNLLKKIWVLYHLVKTFDPDIVQTWLYHANLLGGVAAQVAGVKKIIWGIRTDGQALSWRIRWILKLGAYCSRWIPTFIVFCSKRGLDFHVGKGYAQNKTIYIPNGFDINFFMPATQDEKYRLKEKFGIAQDVFVFGMVARFHYRKDFPNLLRAFALMLQENPKLFLIICGKGLNEKNAAIVNLIQELALKAKVLMIDGVERPQEIYHLLDCCILSSRTEGFPNVIGEAMSCGVPCVATDVGDAADLIGDTGITVPKEDALMLAQAGLTMVKFYDSDRIEWAGRARSRIIDRFSLEKMVKEFNALQ